MKTTIIKIVTACNQDCSFCSENLDKKFADTEKVNAFIDTLEKGSMIVFTGGEPTLHPNIVEFVRRAKLHGLYTNMQTNGSFFSDIRFLGDISPYLDNAVISVISHDKYIWERTIGKKSVYEKTMKGIDNLMRMGLLRETVTPITSFNIGSLYDTVSFLDKKGVKSIGLTALSYEGEARKNRKTIGVSYQEIREAILPILDEFSEKILLTYIPVCVIYPYQNDLFWYSPYGCLENREIYDAVHDYMVNSNNFKATGMRKTNACRKCSYDKVCCGIWDNYFDGTNENDIVPITSAFSLREYPPLEERLKEKCFFPKRGVIFPEG